MYTHRASLKRRFMLHLTVFVHPLVVEVAGSDTSLSTDLAKEAWNYGEMECIQDVVIPRCYGIFQARFSENRMRIKPWFEKVHTETTVKIAVIPVLVLERVGGHFMILKKLSDDDQ